MPIPVILPKFGFTLETATIVQWLKREGDTVRAGDPICEVTTDKVNMEVEAPEAGTLHGLQYEAGTEVPVTQVIAYIVRAGEAWIGASPTKSPESQTTVSTSITTPEPIAEIAATPVARRVAESSNVDLTRLQGSGPNGRIMRRDVESALGEPPGKVRATPAARHLAREAGIDLPAFAGTGPHGRIQGNDVRAAISNLPIEQTVADSTPKPAEEFTIVKLAGMRRTIATRLQQSFQTAPHIFFDAKIDMAGIDSLRQRLKARKEKISITAVIVKACAWTLQRHPWLNATLQGDEISLWSTANIGVAVALEEGLVVPVIHHAERLSMREIQTAVDTLAERARNNMLHVNDVLDGTFTISNLGMYGVDRFTAIINPPQVAILAVGRAVKQFVPDENDQPVVRALMSVTLSADHRVVDGAHAANFLADLRLALEEPALLAW